MRVCRLLGGVMLMIASHNAWADEAASPPSFRLEQPEGRDERLVTDIRINDRAARLIFDTGSGVDWMLFSEALARFDLKVAVAPDEASAPGVARVGQSEAVRLEAFGQTYPEMVFHILKSSPGVDASPQDGLLGWPALRGNVLLFKLGGEAPGISFLEAFPSDEALAGEPVTRLSVVEFEALQLHFADTAGAKRRVRLIIDTGSPDGMAVSPGLWRNLLAANPAAPRTVITSFMVGEGFAVREVFWAETVTVGTLVLHDVPVMEAGPAYWQKAAESEDTIVFGLAALKRVVLMVDASHRRALAYTAVTPAVIPEHNRIGAAFCPGRDKPDGDLFAHVVPGSPAARADVRTGDVLVRVDGVPAATWWMDPALNLQGKLGTVYKLQLRRGDQTIERVVVSEDILGPAPARQIQN